MQDAKPQGKRTSPYLIAACAVAIGGAFLIFFMSPRDKFGIPTDTALPFLALHTIALAGLFAASVQGKQKVVAIVAAPFVALVSQIFVWIAVLTWLIVFDQHV